MHIHKHLQMPKLPAHGLQQLLGYTEGFFLLESKPKASPREPEAAGLFAGFSWAASAISPVQAVAASAWGEGCEGLKCSSLLIYFNEYKLMQFSFLCLADIKGQYDS